MDVKVTVVIVCLCALAIVFTEAGIPRCCIRTKETIPAKLWMRVQRWEVQEATGPCDIRALRLYLKDDPRPICAPPNIRRPPSKRHAKTRNYKQQVTN